MKSLGLTVNELFEKGYKSYASHAQTLSSAILSAPDLKEQDPEIIEAQLVDSRQEAVLMAVAAMIGSNNDEIVKQLNKLGISINSTIEATKH
jgi:hypothetical protein